MAEAHRNPCARLCPSRQGMKPAMVVCRYLASKFGCNTEGITLSPVQAQRAAEICGPRGLADRCHFQVSLSDTFLILSLTAKYTTFYQ